MHKVERRKSKGTVRKILLVIINILFFNPIVFYLVVFLNRRWKLIVSIFVAYPADKRYAEYYFSESLRKKSEWSPALCALMRQDGRWLLGFGISSIEDRLYAEDSLENLKKLVTNANKLKDSIGAEYLTYSGLLPSILHKHKLSESSVEGNCSISAGNGLGRHRLSTLSRSADDIG